MGIGLGPNAVKPPRWALLHVAAFTVWLLARETKIALVRKWKQWRTP